MLNVVGVVSMVRLRKLPRYTTCLSCIPLQRDYILLAYYRPRTAPDVADLKRGSLGLFLDPSRRCIDLKPGRAFGLATAIDEREGGVLQRHDVGSDGSYHSTSPYVAF